MNTSHGRLQLRVDVFEKLNQKARVLPTLVAPELVESILQEFREIEYLGTQPSKYALTSADGEPLDDETPIAHQMSHDDKLILVEREYLLPQRTKKPSEDIYLREIGTGQVYKIPWYPAFIGRPDRNQPNDDWLAVNLESYPRGLRVSRRHAVISERRGEYYIERLSQNPTILERAAGDVEPLSSTSKALLSHGDIVRLERSGIALKFIVRSDKKILEQE